MIAIRNAALAAIASACLVSAASAAPLDPAPVRVATADLDLASAVGRAVLDRRVAAAVRVACATGTSDLEAARAAARCRADATRDVHARVLALVEHRSLQVAAR